MAWWFLLIWLGILAAYEGWALSSQHDTVSQALQRWSRMHPWLRLVEVAGWVVLLWHLFWGGPL